MWVDAFRELEQQRGTLASRVLCDDIPLQVDGSKLTSSAVERASAVLATRLPVDVDAREPKRLLFMLPNPTQSLGRFLAASLLLADFVHRSGVGVRRNETGPLLHGDVLLVTQHIQECVRLLRDVAVKYRTEPLRLSDYWPIHVFSKYSAPQDTKPRVFVANPGWAQTIGVRRAFGSVVVDVSHPRTADHIERLLCEQSIASAPVQILVVPPWETARVDRFANNGCHSCMTWAWDPGAVETLEEILDERFSGSTHESERHLWVCDDEEVSARLGTVHGMLIQAMRTGTSRVSQGLLEAWSVYHRLRQLVVPLVRLEEEQSKSYGTVTLRDRLDAIEEGRRYESNDPQLPEIAHKLKEIYEILFRKREPDKFYTLASCIESHLDCESTQLRIVVPTRNEVGLLVALMGELVDGWTSALQEGRINICTVREEPRVIADGHVRPSVLLGFRTSRLRYLDVYPGVRIDAIVYPFEVQIDAANQNRAHATIECLQDDSARGRVLTALHLPVSRTSNERETPISNASPRSRRAALRYRLVERQPVTQDRDFHDDSMVEPVDIVGLAAASWTDEMLARPDEDASTQDGRSASRSVPFLDVIDTEGNTFQFPETRIVDVYHVATQVKERIRVADLQPGMLMVVLVDAPYEDLFQRVLEAIEEQRDPRASMALELWRQAKEAALVRFGGNRSRLCDSLREQGLSVEYAAVVGWHRTGEEEIMAPLQLSDFRILAKSSGVYSDDALIDVTFNCVKQERSIRRSCGRALGRFLSQIAAGENYEVALETAQAIGTPLEQVAAAVSLREIRELKPANGSWMPEG